MKKNKNHKREVQENVIDRKNKRKNREKKQPRPIQTNEVLGSVINIHDMANSLGYTFEQTVAYIDALGNTGEMVYERKENSDEYYIVDRFIYDENTGEKIERKEIDIQKDFMTLKRLAEGGKDGDDKIKSIHI